MQSGWIEIGIHRVHYIKFGDGGQLLIAIHGFADRARMFAVLEKFLSQHYTVVAFDLPFHGETDWRGTQFSKKDLLQIFEEIRRREGFQRKPFCLMAYSFGARLAQALLPECIADVKKIYLLAPDGFHTRGMTLATRTPVGWRWALYRWLQSPKLFLDVIDFGKKLGIIPRHIHQFLQLNVSHPERLRRTFGCWLSMEDFKTDTQKIQKIYRETGLPVEIYLGKNDDTILFSPIQQMVKELPNVRITWLNSGHRLVGETLGAALVANTANYSCP